MVIFHSYVKLPEGRMKSNLLGIQVVQGPEFNVSNQKQTDRDPKSARNATTFINSHLIWRYIWFP